MSAAEDRFGFRRIWLAKAMATGMLGTAGAGALGIAILHGFGTFSPDRRAIFALLFLGFAILLAGMAGSYAGELLWPRPVVRMQSRGLSDRRLSRQPIPWDVIRGVLPLQNGMQLMLALDVADPHAIAAPNNPLWRFTRRCARLLGYPELVVRVTGLDADLFAVMGAMDAHRPT